MLQALQVGEGLSSDHAALCAACDADVALCTIVGINGSFSRRVGAQLAVHPDGSVTGDLADGCLEQQLASDVREATKLQIKRYGQGSQNIDFRLPCGGGLDILVDLAPDRDSCRNAVKRLQRRQPANLQLAENSQLPQRRYIPALKLRIFGEGRELASLAAIANAAGIATEAVSKDCLGLGQSPDLAPADAMTAVVLLFHDHEWEAALLQHSLSSDAFYIGAQGGETARMGRMARLLELGVAEEQIARVRGPIGTVTACKTPDALALSTLSEVVGEYEALHPHQ